MRGNNDIYIFFIMCNFFRNLLKPTPFFLTFIVIFVFQVRPHSLIPENPSHKKLSSRKFRDLRERVDAYSKQHFFGSNSDDDGSDGGGESGSGDNEESEGDVGDTSGHDGSNDEDTEGGEGDESGSSDEKEESKGDGGVRRLSFEDGEEKEGDRRRDTGEWRRIKETW